MRRSTRVDQFQRLFKDIKSGQRQQAQILAELKAIREELGGYGVRGQLRHIELGVQAALRGIYLKDFDDLEPQYALNARRFRLHSQNDEDGITLALFMIAGTGERRFAEIGCGPNGGTSGFLAKELGWSGLMVDGDSDKVSRLRASTSPTRVQTLVRMIDASNINDILREAGLTGELDLLSIDIDGIDLWIWEAIDAVDPRVVVIEYNSSLGADRSVTIKYEPAFTRRGLGNYYGASLRALVHSGRRRGYRLVAVEPRGVNAFFVRSDIAPELPEIDPADAFRLLDKNERRMREGIDAYAEFARRGLELVEVPPA
jgi:hypothetical protein